MINILISFLSLELPGEKTVFEIDYLAVWNSKLQISYGTVIIPSSLNIPPIINDLIKYEPILPNCEQLHQKLQVKKKLKLKVNFFEN